MTTVGSSDGLELVARAALLALKADLPAEIAVQNGIWTSLDQSYAEAIGVEYSPVILEQIDVGNMYIGHIPSLIEAPGENYPNVALMAWKADNLASGFDQGDEFRISLAAEVMVKSTVSEEDCNRRIQRTSDAVNAVLCRASLGAAIGYPMNRSIQISDVFIRRESKSRGADWFWQGARIDYEVRSLADY